MRPGSLLPLLLSLLMLAALPKATHSLNSQPPRCALGWLPLGATDCLLVGNASVNATEARKFCLSLGENSRLVVLRNFRFNDELLKVLNSSYLAREAAAAVKNSTVDPVSYYWTGAYIANNRIAWMDADEYSDASMSPLPGNIVLSNRYRGKNGALKFDSTVVPSFSMEFLEASNTAPLTLCARQAFDSPKQPAIPFNATARCPGENATLHRGLCYRLLNSPVLTPEGRWNRTDAVKACLSWAPGATLAVVNDFNTEFLATAMISADATGHAWLGLEYKVAEGYWDWLTGQEMRHTNWKPGEPTKLYSREACVVAHQREVNLGEWNNIPCADTFSSALCESQPTVTDMPAKASFVPTPIGLNSTRCKPGFYEYGKACWLLGSDKQSGNRSAMAQQCTALYNGSSLAFFHLRGEQAFLSALAEQLGRLNVSVWLGLNVRLDQDDPGGWLLTWDDGSPADYDFVWKVLPTQVKSVGSGSASNPYCTALALDDNSLEARLCNDTNVRLACRYNLEEHPLTPSKHLELRCDTDGKQQAVNGKCFELITAKDAVNWTGAALECAKFNATLASIHSRQEQMAITEKLTASSKDAWIGLQVLDHEGTQRMLWSDGSPVDFYHFRHDHPKTLSGSGTSSAVDALCVMVRKQYGEWLSGDCDRPLSFFVCQRPGSPAPATTVMAASTPPIAVAPNTTASPHTLATTTPAILCRPENGAVTSELTADGKTCLDFLYSDSSKSWKEARAWCVKNLPGGGDLASIGSQIEEDAAMRLLAKLDSKQPMVWLGSNTDLSPVANAFAVWSDGTPMRYANFAPDSEDRDLTVALRKSDCIAAIFAGQHNSGAWQAIDCATRLPALCKRLRRPASPAAASVPNTLLNLNYPEFYLCQKKCLYIDRY